ncbi:fumarylacetoacetate hydrolase family protein [Pseudoclavibacter sp. CFCC 13796]|uniref:fumarylacetoacetate hydrolase family protein n=1 Tax=Pseudoclavibacter sp. CFCC 13796 TaxID=2615179 RepID=UPI001300FB65|nr:fumarylacetoacetate hydrolase family protein [Pseudoclavibacter sp. CFCC 13796]KAB1659813.1 fumarylacetoacetate hydrolase family protein [Pseudoclavibacter sp. CFCC 13796]
MKIARFSHEGADPAFGIIDGDEIVVLSGDPMFAGYDTTGDRVPLAEAHLLAPVIPRSKVIAVGRNYAAHAAEKGNAVPTHPLLFFKPNTSVVGPGDPIVIPEFAGTVEPEAELAIVIGRVVKNLPREHWQKAVFGYTLGNDVSARTLQQGDGQWARAKGMDTFCPLGPVIETELDPAAVTVTSSINGEAAQSGETKDFIFDVPTLLEFISQAFTLLPGDVILTGTPAGVRPIVPGDSVTVAATGIGELTNPVRAAL